MQLKIKREKQGYNQYRLSVRAEYTPAEQSQLRKHDDLARLRILYRPTDRDLKDLNRKDGIVPMLFKAVMGNPGGNELIITAASLEHGHVLQGFMQDVAEAESEIRENCETLLDRLDVGDLYDGEEQVVELGRNRGTVTRAEPPREEA